MKRLFTIAIIAMAASLTFAQAPLAKKSTASNRLERVANVETLTKKAKQAKETQAAMAEKAAVEKETSYSMLRKASVNRGLFNSIKEEKRGGKLSSRGCCPEVTDRCFPTNPTSLTHERPPFRRAT